MEKSRRQEHIQQQTRRNILLALLGRIGVFVVIFFFGMEILISFSVALNKLKGENISETTTTATTKNAPTYIAPPRLNAIPDATKEETITLSGNATSGDQIILYVNNKKADQSAIKSDNTFSFSQVKLTPGENNIKAKTSIGSEESDYSEKITIRYLNKPPELTVEAPTDGQTISKDNKKITIIAKTDAGAKITINGSWAIEKGEGKFYHSMILNEGENAIVIEAVDDAGNKTTKEVKVKVE